MDVSEFQKLMKDLYFSKDNERGIPATFLWFVEEVGELSEAIRHLIVKNNGNKKIISSDRKKKIGEEMADIIAWLSSLANLMDINIEHELFSKYPGKCGRCGKIPCECERF